MDNYRALETAAGCHDGLITGQINVLIPLLFRPPLGRAGNRQMVYNLYYYILSINLIQE